MRMWSWCVPVLGLAVAIGGGLQAFAEGIPSAGPWDDTLLIGGTLLVLISLMAHLRRFVQRAADDFPRG